MSKTKHDELYELYRLTDKAKPKPEDVQALRDFLIANPKKALYIGDLAIQAETQLLHQAFSDNKGGEVACDEVLHLMRKSLGIDTATALEKPLIYHVCLCWLRLQLFEIKYTQGTGGSLTLEQGMYWEKKLAAHQKRYLKAVETLGRIRKLNLNIQINIGEKQLIAG